MYKNVQRYIETFFKCLYLYLYRYTHVCLQTVLRMYVKTNSILMQTYRYACKIIFNCAHTHTHAPIHMRPDRLGHPLAVGWV